MIYDFHTHSSLSDGSLSPVELIRRAHVRDYKAIGITDHVGVGYLDRLIREVTEDCALATQQWDIIAIPGVELTHLPPLTICEAAQHAKELGARLVIVHGESIVEPVEEGTNAAAVQCPYVDILAHPGLITPEEANLAAANGVFLEISARKGHSLTNGHVCHLARLAGAKLLVNSDAHGPADLLRHVFASQIAQGAGLSEDESTAVLTTNALVLLERLSLPFSSSH